MIGVLSCHNATACIIYAGISKRSQRGGLENRLPKRHGGSNPSSCAKNEAPILAVGAFIFAWNERILTPLCDSSSRRMGFAYPTRRSKSSLFRRRVRVSSPLVNTPLQGLLLAGRPIFIDTVRVDEPEGFAYRRHIANLEAQSLRGICVARSCKH